MAMNKLVRRYGPLYTWEDTYITGTPIHAGHVGAQSFVWCEIDTSANPPYQAAVRTVMNEVLYPNEYKAIMSFQDSADGIMHLLWRPL